MVTESQLAASEVSVIADCGDLLGEGPLWDHRKGQLLWIDILRGIVHTWSRPGQMAELLRVDALIGSIALYGKSDLLLATSKGLMLWRGEFGRIDQWLNPIAKKPVRFNDGRVDARGRFWIGTMALDEKRYGEPLGELCRVDRSGEVRRMEQGLTIATASTGRPTGARCISPTRCAARSTPTNSTATPEPSAIDGRWSRQAKLTVTPMAWWWMPMADCGAQHSPGALNITAYAAGESHRKTRGRSTLDRSGRARPAGCNLWGCNLLGRGTIMSSGTVLVADPIDGDVSIIAQKLTSLGFSTLSPTPEQPWLDLAERADGLIVNLAVVDANALSRLSRCKVITRLGVGINNIDIATAKERNIVVTNVPDYCRHEVSEHALGLMIALVRKLVEASADVQRGDWHQLGYRPVRRLSGMTLGLVGFGRIAQSVAQKAMALGMRVVTSDPYVPDTVEPSVQRLSLRDLFEQSDIVSLHAPLVPETRGLIGRASLAQMKRGVFLINTSRGELIDESALAEALDSGQVAGAGLDVLCAEPLQKASPLRGRANVIITPHMAFYSEDALVLLQITAAEDVARFLSGLAPKFRAA